MVERNVGVEKAIILILATSSASKDYVFEMYETSYAYNIINQNASYSRFNSTLEFIHFSKHQHMEKCYDSDSVIIEK